MCAFVYGNVWNMIYQKHKQTDIWKQKRKTTTSTLVWWKVLSFCLLAESMQQKNIPKPPTK